MKLFDQSLNNPRIRKAVKEFQDISFNGTYNVLALNEILDYDNLYNFALKCNRQQGLNINVITENTIIKNGKTIKDIFEYENGSDFYTIQNIDFIRLALICDYGINNFIDLDLIINAKIDYDWINCINCKTNWSMILGHNKITKFMYEIDKLRKEQNMQIYDGLYDIPQELLTWGGVILHQKWIPENVFCQ